MFRPDGMGHFDAREGFFIIPFLGKIDIENLRPVQDATSFDVQTQQLFYDEPLRNIAEKYAFKF